MELGSQHLSTCEIAIAQEAAGKLHPSQIRKGKIDLAE
jgi:hypothetical protein